MFPERARKEEYGGTDHGPKSPRSSTAPRSAPPSTSRTGSPAGGSLVAGEAIISSISGTGTNRTLSPGKKNVGGFSRGSNNRSEERPMRFQPPGVGDG